MTRKRVILLLITMFSILAPIVNANAPTESIIDTYTIEGQGASDAEGYIYFGLVNNKYFVSSLDNVVIEVSLFDDAGYIMDTVETMPLQSVIERGSMGSFIARSTTKEEVAEVKTKLVSYDKTDKINFLYLELSQIVFKNNGVEGRFTNIHDNQWVEEAEVIVTFHDTDGKVVDIQSWGANEYGRFNSDQSETFSITSEKVHASKTISVQCNRYSRYIYPKMSVLRPNKVLDSWMPPIGETIILEISNDPQYSWSGIDVLITDPLGTANTVQFDSSGYQNFRYGITPTVPGVWNVTWAWEPFATDGGYTQIESGVLNTGFFTWEPETVESTTEEDTETTDTVEYDTSVNETGVILEDLEPEPVDLTEGLPEEIKRQIPIPGFPVMSVMVAFSVVYVLFSRKY